TTPPEPSRVPPSPGWRSRSWRAVQVLVTAVVLLVLLDLAAGWAWDRTLGSPDEAAVDTPFVASAEEGGNPAAERLVDTSERADVPAMADAPWAEEYFFELDTLRSRWDPFLVNRAYPTSGEHISTTEDTRVSYEPAGLAEDAPVVWFFGGSTTFGEGQRDEHTIPSEVARLSEEAGSPVRVVNFGQRGWVIWQEALQLERQLAVREAPDLVVFYDGTNDVNVQVEQGGGQPTVYNADDYAATVEGAPRAEDGTPAKPPSLARRLFDSWRETSLVGEVSNQVAGVAPAWAGESEQRSPEAEQEAVDDAVAVYQRGRAFVLDLAAEHDVPVVLFWQPELDTSTNPTSVRADAAEAAGAPTIDLTDALTGVPSEDVYLDGAHTNELGARLVAEAMWPHLTPALGTGSS
ncbi:hypothetical protein B7486_52495, partial [cyanobacterium TDX16]